MKKSKRRIAYEKYIASSEWKRKRLERIAIDNNQCRMCGSTDRLEVHHRYPDGYKNIPNESIQDDLTTLCSLCHEAIHNSINARKYLQELIPINIMPRVTGRKLISYGMENSTISTSRNLSNDLSQRRFSQSDEQDSEKNETYFRQTEKDRSRFRGIG